MGITETDQNFISGQLFISDNSTIGGTWNDITASGYANDYRSIPLRLEAGRAKPPPAYMKLLDARQKLIERSDRSESHCIVKHSNRSKRGFIPYFNWSVKRQTDVIVR